MKNLKNNLIVWALAVWLGFGVSGHCINYSRNTKLYPKNDEVYKNETDFHKEFEIERRKLGLENIPISCETDLNHQGGCTFKKQEGYLIKFNPEYKNKKVLRHELYHVKQWEEGFNLKEIADFLTCGNYEEFMATSYSIE